MHGTTFLLGTTSEGFSAVIEIPLGSNVKYELDKPAAY